MLDLYLLAQTEYYTVKSSVADPDPGSGAFLTPGSGIRNRFFPDPGSQIPDPESYTHIFESLATIFWLKISIILQKLAPNIFPAFQKYNNVQFCEICGYIKRYDIKFFFTPLFCCCFWIRDPRSGFRDGKKSGSGIRDKHPGSATLVLTLEYVHFGPDLDLEKHNRLDPTL